MYSFLLILSRVAYVAVGALELMLLLRAVLSWIMPYDSNAVTVFLYRMTEPIISPVRQLTYRIPFFRTCPIDLSFLIVVILLGAVENMLLSF